jgi:hypothetical protein
VLVLLGELAKPFSSRGPHPAGLTLFISSLSVSEKNGTDRCSRRQQSEKRVCLRPLLGGLAMDGDEPESGAADPSDIVPILAVHVHFTSSRSPT